MTTLSEGFHSDGSNLYLRVTSPTSRQWVFRYSSNGKVRQLGVGSTIERTLVDARALAQKMREAVCNGVDPASLLRARDPNLMTFRLYAEELIEAKRKEFRSEKWGKQWSATLEKYVYPGIGHKRAADISLADIEAILRPIWNSKTETANRVRSRVASILDYAYVNEGIEKKNPAVFRGGLEHRGFGKPRKVSPIRHHPAAPYSEVPAIMAALRDFDTTTALCLRFTILTWVRSSEARGAAWEEIDIARCVWTIPGRRMKAGRDHIVPLCDEAIEILERMEKRRLKRARLVFAGSKGGMVSDVGINKLLHSLKPVRALDDEATEKLRASLPPRDREGVLATGATVHGFRSAARSWGAAKTQFAREVLELALAHENSNKVESAYQRDNMFDKRRALMIAWEQFCSVTNIVPFSRSLVG